MVDLTVLKNKIINFEKDYKINYFIINNIFWYDNYFRIIKQNNKKIVANFISFFNNNIEYHLEIVVCLFYLEMKFIERKLFILLDLSLLKIRKKDNKIKIYLDPEMKILNINNVDKDLLLKIFNFKKYDNSDLLKLDKFIQYNIVFLLKLKNSINKKRINQYIKLFYYDNLTN